MGSIQKRPNGKWRARYRDPDGKEHARHFERKTDAQKWLAGQVTKVADGVWVDPRSGRRTFESYAREWLGAQVHHRPSTTSITTYRLEGHLIPAFGDRPLVAIQRSEVQAWVSSLQVSPSHAEGLYRLLAQIMLAAVEDRLIASTPCRRINLPQRVQSRIEIPTTEQVARVHSFASPHGKAVVLTAAATGMRVSELAGLTKDRVDFLRRVVTVDRQLVSVVGKDPRFGPPKTKASVREIPIPVSLVEVIARHLEEYPSPDVVFRTQDGRPWTRKAMSGEWRRWCGLAQTPFRFHDLRHFFASGLIAAGQSVKVVQERLGHASATETLNTYAHLWPADEDATREAIDGLVASVLRTHRGQPEQIPRSGA